MCFTVTRLTCAMASGYSDSQMDYTVRQPISYFLPTKVGQAGESKINGQNVRRLDTYFYDLFFCKTLLENGME